MTLDEVRNLSDDKLLSKIAEECSEVIQAAMKHAAHGPTPFAGGVQYDNVQDVQTEFAQLTRLISEYGHRFGYRRSPLP
jgi:phosphoribosyl-ATP pyrophosphohydrolase